MTRPDLRTPRPGELLRAATSKRATPPQSLSATPWQGNATAAGLRAIDREMIYLDEKAMQAVAEARAEIAQAQEDIAAAVVQLGALDGRMDETETAVQDAVDAVATVRDETIPALQGRLDDAEYDVKHISAEWITGGTIDTARLNAVDIAAATATIIEIDADRIVSGTIDTARLSATEIWGEIATIGQIITEDLIAAGAVTTSALNVVSTTGTGYSWRLNNGGLFAMHSESDIAARFDAGGLRMWDESGKLTIRINGVQNYFQGEFRTVLPGGGRGVIIANTGQDLPGIWFTSTGGGGDNVPGLRLSVGATPADDRLVIQKVAAMRYNRWRAGLATATATHTGGAERNPGVLSWTANRDAPVTLGGGGLVAREDGFYTICHTARVSSRPGVTTRAFVQINYNGGAVARTPHSGENFGTVTWAGWAFAGSRFDFTQYMDSSGSYTLNSTITVIYHGN